MPKTQKQTQEETPTPMNPQRLNISEIDLETMRLRDLIALRDRVDAVLREINTLDLNEDDVRVEYNIKIYTRDGDVMQNVGHIQLNKFTHPRNLADSPSTFEQAFTKQVKGPTMVDMYDILEKNNPTDHSLNALRQNLGDDSHYAVLPAPVDTFPI